MINGIEKLFKRRKRTVLTPEEVKMVEGNILHNINKNIVMRQFKISKGTYYAIKGERHKYSTRRKQDD